MARSETGGTWSQADTRRRQLYTDNHGRRWASTVDNRTGKPIGLLQPGFKAPWYPDQAYLRFDENDQSKIWWDYDLMLQHRIESHEEYHRRATEEATARSWAIDTDDSGRPVYEKKLLQIIGNPPRPIEPIVAAMQGNKWILGLTAKVDERLVPFLPSKDARKQAVLRNLPDFSDSFADEGAEFDEDEEPPMSYTEFVSLKRSEGLDMKAIGPLWKTYKQSLATAGAR